MTESVITDEDAQREIIDYIQSRMPGILCVVLVHDNDAKQSVPISNMIPEHAVDFTERMLAHMKTEQANTHPLHTIQ